MHEEQQVTNWSYDPTLPIVIVFKKVDDLMDLAQAAGSPYSAQQIINFAYIILNKTGKITQGIKYWNCLPQDQKTRGNFQIHFSNEHRAIRESGELENCQSTFDTANIIQEVVDGIQQALNPTEEEIEETSSLIHQANIATAKTDQQTLLMKQMLEMIQQMQAHMVSNTTTPFTTHSSRNGQNTEHRRRRNTSKYCWSHGACAHWGHKCTNKKSGHIDDATFQDRKGGSTAYVRNT